MLKLGIKPVVVTRHPDSLRIDFVNDIRKISGAEFDACIISSATADHYKDLKSVLTYTKGIKRILVEKPIEASVKKAGDIARIAGKRSVYAGYNLRFLNAFSLAAQFIKNNTKSIRLVEVVAGEDLRRWRPKRRLSGTYSAHRNSGGGVDLDLSHELDYVLWLLGDNFRNKLVFRDKISNLPINAPDVCNIVLGYKDFLVNITLDYIRPQKERYLKITCSNAHSLFFNLVTGVLEIDGRVVFKKQEMNASYVNMMRAFLSIDKNAKRKLCTLKQAVSILGVLEV